MPERYATYIVIAAVTFAVVNGIVVDISFYQKLQDDKRKDIMTTAGEQQAKNGQLCPVACTTQIEDAIKSLPASTSSSASSLSTPVSAVSFVKEFFVPFGTGSSTALDWTDVSGMQASIDQAQYGTIKSVMFEVTVRVPAGSQTVYVRLYNATDKHPVWYSEVSFDGSGPILLTSAPVMLDLGKKTYQVQVKTQLGGQVAIDQARLHITVQ